MTTLPLQSKWVIAAAVVIATSGSVSNAAEPMDIGSRLELFVDDYLIESMSGVSLKLHSPKRENVAIRFDDV